MDIRKNNLIFICLFLFFLLSKIKGNNSNNEHTLAEDITENCYITQNSDKTYSIVIDDNQNIQKILIDIMIFSGDIVAQIEKESEYSGGAIYAMNESKLLLNDSIIKDKSNANKSFLNMSNIRANKSQKMKIDEKEKMSKSSSEYFNRKNIFGTVDKNKKEFYLSVEFSHKIVNINKHIDKNLLNHYFPMIHNK